ncbi:hypothetical protein [Taibaiella koreensis]|uniref:hypothetical protein n=1 Tax=Taibaiella koreensis TaxID=1268548 RepID=UPI000E5A08ED|nr:hypothetical protein [Taibaiella koreensis]
MIYFPGLDVQKSRQRRWLTYKESIGSRLERYAVYLIFTFQLLCLTLIFNGLDAGNSNDLFLMWFLMPLLMLLALYILVLKALEKFLKKRTTVCSKKENKTLLQQLATRRRWQTRRLSGDCLIYTTSEHNFSYNVSTIMVFLVEDGRILYSLFRKRPRLDIPSLFEIWLLRYDMRMLSREAMKANLQAL